MFDKLEKAKDDLERAKAEKFQYPYFFIEIR